MVAVVVMAGWLELTLKGDLSKLTPHHLEPRFGGLMRYLCLRRNWFVVVEVGGGW